MEFPQEIRTIFVACDEELRDEHYYRRLWIVARNLKIPRRGWPDSISCFFRDLDVNGIEIVHYNYDPYEIPFIDDYLTDPECRWLSDYFQADESGSRPKRQSKKFELLRIIDIFIKGAYPRLSKHYQK